MPHASQEAPRPVLSVIRCRQTRGAGITLDPEAIDRKEIPTTTTGAWNLLEDTRDGWVENVARLLDRHAAQRDDRWVQWAQRHMADLERRARYWPKKDRAERIACQRATMEEIINQSSNATALPGAAANEATGAYAMLWSVRGGITVGRTIHMTVVAPDGSEVVRTEVVAEPIAVAARTARALFDLAESLNATRGRALHLTH